MKLFFFSVVLMTSSLSPARSQSVVTDVQLGCMTPMFAYPDDNPLAVIASQVTKNQGATRFRASWYGSLGSGWNKGTMLYDKKRGIIKYYDIGGAGEDRKQFYRKSYLFTGVEAISLVALVDKYNNRSQIKKLFPFSFLDTLPANGYRKFKLTDYKKGF